MEREKEQEGRCPICGSENLSYEPTEQVDDGGFALYKCLDCEFLGCEHYEYKFTEHRSAVESLSISHYIQQLDIRECAEELGYSLEQIEPNKDFLYPIYIEIYLPIAGYKYQVVQIDYSDTVNVEPDPASRYYSPERTAYFAYGTEREAIPDMLQEACMNEYPIRHGIKWYRVHRS